MTPPMPAYIIGHMATRYLTRKKHTMPENPHWPATNSAVTTENPAWARSTFCSGGQCVEVAQVGDQIWLRDSKNPDTEPIRFDHDQWAAFLNGLPR